MAPKKASATATGKAAAPTAADFNTGDIVLTKIKGYPDWPSKVMEHDSAPANVQKQRQNRSLLVRFFPDGDYAWISPKETKALSSKSIDAYLSDTGKKNGKLKDAYKIAKDPTEWEADQEKKRANGDFDVQDDDEDEDVDMLDEDGEEKPTGSKKRKRSAAADKKTKEPAAPKAKKETAAKKRKVEEDKKPKSAGKAKAAPKKDAAAKKDSAAADDNSEGAKTVKGWRATLQKAFLTKGVPPAEKMVEYDEIFKAMESFEMQAEWLASSKLGKVLKKMSTLDNIEKEEEYKLKERCNTLMEKWKEMLNKEGGDDAPGVAAAGGAGQVAGTDAPAANGEAGDLTMQDASAADEKKTEAGVGGGVNANGQTNGAEEKKEEAPAAETNGSA